jgi:hypothetical protein
MADGLSTVFLEYSKYMRPAPVLPVCCKRHGGRLGSAPPMAEDLIRYDVLAQDALRGLVRKVLTEVVQAGLPGEHHFFITFNTRYPGVRISSRLMADYPGEMTIVLQHQFWDLAVTDSSFEVGLSFKGVPEKLHVPLRAITSFVDPHASFALKFDIATEAEAEAGVTGAEAAPAEEAPPPVKAIADGKKPPRAKRSDKADKPAKTKDGEAAAVVSLDAFRKKNG